MKVSCKNLDIKISDMLFVAVGMVNLSVMFILDFVLNDADSIAVARVISITIFISNLLHIQAKSMLLDKEFSKIYNLNILIMFAILSLFTGNILVILFAIYTVIRYLVAYTIEYTAYALPKLYARIGVTIVFLTVITFLVLNSYIKEVDIAFLIAATLSISIVTFYLLVRFGLLKYVYSSLFLNVLDSLKFMFYSSLRLSDDFVRAVLDFILFMLSITFVTNGVEWLELQYSIMILFRVLDGIMCYMVTRYIVYINNNQLSYSYKGMKVVLKASLILNVISALSFVIILSVLDNSLKMVTYFVCLYFIFNILGVVNKCFKVEFKKNNRYKVIAITMVISVLGTLANVYFKSVYLIPVVLIVSVLLENVVLFYHKQFKCN